MVEIKKEVGSGNRIENRFGCRGLVESRSGGRYNVNIWEELCDASVGYEDRLEERGHAFFLREGRTLERKKNRSVLPYLDETRLRTTPLQYLTS